MEFLVEFEVEGPAGTPDAQVEQHQRAGSAAAAKLAAGGHLVRLWRRPLAGDGTTAIGLYRAGSEAELDGLLAGLPLAGWLRVTVTPLEAHPKPEWLNKGVLISVGARQRGGVIYETYLAG